jgi:hypothetical protein
VRASNPAAGDSSPDQIRRIVASTQTKWRKTSATVHPSQRDGDANSSTAMVATVDPNRLRCSASAVRVMRGSNRKRT